MESVLDPIVREALAAALRFYHERRECAAHGEFLPLAKLGVPEAQYRVAKIYIRGCTSPETSEILYPRANRWFKLAAHRGHPLAQFEMQIADASTIGSATGEWSTSMLELDHCWMSDSQQAYAEFLARHHAASTSVGSEEVGLLERAANGGVVEAMRDLGDSCWSCGRKHDALLWMERAALANSVQAQYLLALWYSTDIAVKDNEKAEYWYRSAAAAGSAEALFNLGQMLLDSAYLADETTVLDVALRYLVHAAMSESQGAQMVLVQTYQAGLHGAQKDALKSEFWHQRALSWATRSELRSLAFAKYVAAIDDSPL